MTMFENVAFNLEITKVTNALVSLSQSELQQDNDICKAEPNTTKERRHINGEDTVSMNR